MREIEIKARISSPAAIEEKLTSFGIRLSEAVTQHDVVYGKPGAKDNALDSVWLRIRTENAGKHIFTLKRSVSPLDSIEYETEIKDADELHHIIQELGYELYSDLTKTRRKAKYQAMEICLDRVEGLGDFVEAELMQDKESDHEEAVSQLWEFFSALGIERRDEVLEGYDVLERRLRGLTGSSD